MWNRVSWQYTSILDVVVAHTKRMPSSGQVAAWKSTPRKWRWRRPRFWPQRPLATRLTAASSLEDGCRWSSAFEVKSESLQFAISRLPRASQISRNYCIPSSIVYYCFIFLNCCWVFVNICDCMPLNANGLKIVQGLILVLWLVRSYLNWNREYDEIDQTKFENDDNFKGVMWQLQFVM